VEGGYLIRIDFPWCDRFRTSITFFKTIARVSFSPRDYPSVLGEFGDAAAAKDLAQFSPSLPD
jgi:hypothetical protein